MHRVCSSLVLVLLLFMQPVAAAELGGAPRVVDGDTLRIGQTEVRLAGIDAPERTQTCTGPGGTWACGAWATEALRQLVAGRRVECVAQGTDRYGRMLARCRAQGVELNAALVRQGAAVAYRRYSTAYAPQEQAARAAGLGIWAGTMLAPEDFRQRDAAATVPAEGGCRIKGNISASGRIYHLPGQAHYPETQVNPGAGERWFCSADEAEAAGWRAARR